MSRLLVVSVHSVVGRIELDVSTIGGISVGVGGSFIGCAVL